METVARMGVLSTCYLRHAYGRDSPRLHEESGVLSANGGVLCAGCGEEAVSYTHLTLPTKRIV